MTRRERVLAAINHHDTDIVPYQISLTIPAYQRLIKYVGDPGWFERIGNHITGAGSGETFTEIESRPGYWRDHFGVVWNKTVDKDIGIVDGLVLPERTLARYEFPVIDEARLRQEYRHVLENAEDTCTITAIGFSMFERAWTLRGMENLLMDMVDAPEFVGELLDRICEYNLKIVNIALDFPFDGFYFGDDWGQQKGLIMGPDHWRTHIKPRMARMFEKVKKTGRFVSLHSCGDIHELFPELIDIGLDVYQTFQPEIYGLRETKREFGKHLTFWGGISTQRTLPWVTPDEVKRIARETMAVMGRGGGYIAAPTHDVPGDVPPENIIALAEAFQKQ